MSMSFKSLDLQMYNEIVPLHLHHAKSGFMKSNNNFLQGFQIFVNFNNLDFHGFKFPMESDMPHSRLINIQSICLEIN